MIGALVASVLMTQAAPGVVMPGVLDLPVIEGSAPSPDCMGYRERMSQGGETLECFGTTVGQVNDLAFAYVDAARERGWADASGAANAIWMARTLPDGTCQRLTIAGMWDFERTPEPGPTTPGFVVLSLKSDIRCPAQSPAQ